MGVSRKETPPREQKSEMAATAGVAVAGICANSNGTPIIVTARHQEATTARAVQAFHAQGIIVQAVPARRTVVPVLHQGAPALHHVVPREAEDVEDAVSPNGPVL